MTPAKLRACTCKDLSRMARQQGVKGWHSMRKEELIRALARRTQTQPRASGEVSGEPGGSSRISAKVASGKRHPAAANGTPHRLSGKRMTAAQLEARRKLSLLQAQLIAQKNLSNIQGGGQQNTAQDRLVVMVRDPYWLHAYWELSPRSIERAQSALGQRWHNAVPMLRVFRLAHDGSSTLERLIQIHGGVNNWYVDVRDPPAEYRMEIGYSAGDDQFHCLSRSNHVTTPPAAMGDAADKNWSDVAEHADRIFAMSGGYSPQGMSLELQELLEERLRRPMGTPMQTRFGDGAMRAILRPDDMCLAVDAELIIYGISHPEAHLTMEGEPVPLRSDGSFAVRMGLSDRRQIIPVVASSPDGSEQRTIILAVERNTKVLEPMIREKGK